MPQQNAVISIILKARDRASGVLNKFLGKLRGLNSTLGRLGLAASAAGVFLFARAMFQLGTSVEETESKFKTTFGTFHTLLDVTVDKFSVFAGISRTTARELLATSGALVQGMGVATEASVEMADSVLRLGADMASFHNRDTLDVVQAINSALTGEAERLKTLGIALKNEDVIKRALLDTGKARAAQLTKEELVQARLNEIYRQAGVAVGDLERTQGSLQNRTRRLSARLANFREQLATELLPAFEDMVGIVETNVGTITALARIILTVAGWFDTSGKAVQKFSISLSVLVTRFDLFEAKVTGVFLRIGATIVRVAARVARFMNGLPPGVRIALGLGSPADVAGAEAIAESLEERARFNIEQMELGLAGVLKEAERRRAEIEAGGRRPGDVEIPRVFAPRGTGGGAGDADNEAERAAQFVEALKEAQNTSEDLLRLVEARVKAGEDLTDVAMRLKEAHAGINALLQNRAALTAEQEAKLLALKTTMDAVLAGPVGQAEQIERTTAAADELLALLEARREAEERVGDVLVELMATHTEINALLRDRVSLTNEQEAALLRTKTALDEVVGVSAGIAVSAGFEQMDVGMPRRIEQVRSFGEALRDAALGYAALNADMRSFSEAGVDSMLEGFARLQDGVARTFMAIGAASGQGSRAIKRALLGTLGAVAQHWGAYFQGRAFGAAATGDFRGAALFQAGAAALFTLAGRIGGAGGVGGGGGVSRGDFDTARRTDGFDRGEAQIIVQGGFLDMTDPAQARALANAIENLTGRRVVVIGAED